MKGIRILFIFLALAMGFASVEETKAQVQYFYGIDTDNYPTVEWHYVFRDGLGNNNFQNPEPDKRLKSEDFMITENGEERVPVVDCGFQNDTPAVYMAVVVNNGVTLDETVAGFKLSRWVQDGLQFMYDSLYFNNGTQVMWANFRAQENVVQTFTSNRDALKSHIGNFKPEPGSSDFLAPFRPPGLDVFAEFDKLGDDVQKVILFVTDKYESEKTIGAADINYVVNAAKERKIMIMTISLDQQHTSFEMEQIASRTGGMQWNPRNKNEAIRDFREVAFTLQNPIYCKITWQAPYACDQGGLSRQVTVEIPSREKEAQKSYTAPQSALASLEITAEELIFGKPDINSHTESVAITNNSPAFDIEEITFEPTGYFELKSPSLPINIKNGEEITLQFGYSATPPDEPVEVTATINAPGFVCQDKLPSINLKADWFEYKAALEVTSIDMGEVMEFMSHTESVECALQNESSGEIKVNVTIIDDADGDFSFESGGGMQTVSMDNCLGFDIKFAPEEAGSGTKTAKVKIEVVEPEHIHQSYEIELTGKVTPNSVQELYSAGDALSLTASPNPVADMLRINFKAPQSGFLTLNLYNMAGDKVDNLVSEELNIGGYEAIYSVSALTPGVYFLKLQSGKYFEIIRFVVTK